MKRVLSILMIVMILGGLNVHATEVGSFSDIGGHWAKENIEQLVDAGVVDGFPDGSFQPQGTVPIEQFVKIVVVA